MSRCRDFPAVERDFSLLLPDGTHFSDVVKAIRSLNISEFPTSKQPIFSAGRTFPAEIFAAGARTFQSREATADRYADRRLQWQNRCRA